MKVLINHLLKLSVQSLIFIYALGIYSNGEIALADNLIDINHNLSNNSATKTNIDNLIDQNTEIQISLKRRRLTLYRGKTRIKSYRVAIGRRGWETPTGNFQVLEMLKNPTWIHPITGKAIPGGKSQNPLGNYWIGFWTNGHNWVGFHGTPNPESIGKAVSHGCIRMYNKDIQELFYQVSPGTPVTVVR